MARNKNPEETVNLILDVSYRLFLEKGYEQTTIQDIVDQLGGLTKGAVYHHFKSKEDILDAMIERMTGSLVAKAVFSPSAAMPAITFSSDPPGLFSKNTEICFTLIPLRLL